MRFRVVCGDALEIRGVPGLVVPANRQLTLGWGTHVAEAVARRAGPEPERQALAAHPEGIALGEAVTTPAGLLPGFTHLIHAAVLDKYDFNPLFLLRLRERTSGETLARATRAALDRAEEAGLSGLVFTPMGAGIGGMRDARCAEIMVREARRFARERPGGPLAEVVFACAKERTAEAFRARLALPEA